MKTEIKYISKELAGLWRKVIYHTWHFNSAQHFCTGWNIQPFKFYYLYRGAVHADAEL